MPLIPLLLLNKEAYGGLPLWSCLVFCFLLRALQLSEAFPTVQRQTHFTEKTHEECTPLHNNNNNKKILSNMSHQMLLSVLTTMEIQSSIHPEAHSKHWESKRYTQTGCMLALCPDDCIFLQHGVITHNPFTLYCNLLLDSLRLSEHRRHIFPTYSIYNNKYNTTTQQIQCQRFK